MPTKKKESEKPQEQEQTQEPEKPPEEEKELLPIQSSNELATATDLYGAMKSVEEFAKIVQKVAPWGQQFKPTEVGLVVRRSLGMGLDPLNPHEVQVWKDKRGQICFQLAYTLVTEWVKRFKGEHTEPIFYQLSDIEAEGEGLSEGDVAFYATFIMTEDMPRMHDLIKMGFDPKEAKSMVTVKGIGVATKAEYSGQYFVPAGRSRAWKLKKRAMVDAYRCKFGTPTRAEIMELRRRGTLEAATTADWEVASDDGEEESFEGRVRLAELSANTRQTLDEWDSLNDEEKKARFEQNKRLLRGDPDADITEGHYTEVQPEAVEA